MRTPFLIAVAVLCASAFGQSIAISSPTASQSISGTSFTFTSTLTSLPSVCSVEYDVNGELAGITYTPPWSYTWNTFYVANNPYNTVTATARDCLNVTLATSSAIAFTVANTLPEPAATLALSVTAPAFPWSGTVSFTIQLSGTGAATHCTNTTPSCPAYLFVDGKMVLNQFGPLVGTTALTPSLDTTQFDNGTHTIVWVVTDGSNPLGASIAWNNLGQWEKQGTFSNTNTTAMELRANDSFVQMCMIGTINCPSTFTLTASIARVDESSVAATTPSFSSGDTSVVTVGGSSGVLTSVGPGSTQVTITDASGKTRLVWVHVNPAGVNYVPHFLNNGSIVTQYSAGHSLWFASLFQSSTNLSDGFYPASSSYGADYAAAGYNAIETGIWQAPGFSQTQGSWSPTMSSYVSAQAAAVSPYGLYLHLTGDGAVRGTPDIFNTTQGAAASYTPPAVQIAAGDWINNRVIGMTVVDEVNSIWGTNPLQVSPVIGSAGFSQIAGNGSVCTVTWTAWSVQSGTNTFIITGSGTALDYNTATNSPQPFTITNTSNPNSFPFNCSFNGTITSGSNPGTTIQPYVAWTYDASANACAPGGLSAGPCTNWVKWDAFQNFRTWWTNAGAGAPALAWANAQGYNKASITGWSASGIADYSEFYYNPDLDYLPQYNSQFVLIHAIGDTFRQRYGWVVNNGAPILSEAGATNIDYGFQGYPITISSISNDLVTFSAPHGINSIIPFDTRLWISGSSNSAYNTNFYVRDCPTATTCHIALWKPTFTYLQTTGLGATANVSDGTTFPVYSLQSDSTSQWGTQFINNSDNGTCSLYHTPNKRGMTMTFTQGAGPSIGTFATTSWWYIPADISLPCATWAGIGFLAQLPSGSSTGGTASIVLDSRFVRGINYIGPGNSETGPRWSAATVFYAMLLPSAGTREYIAAAYLDDPARRSTTPVFQDTTNLEVQIGPHPQYLQYGNAQMWNAQFVPNQLAQRLAKYLFARTFSCPDLGQYFDCALRKGTYGNIQMHESFADAPITRTIDISGCAVGGQNTIRYLAGWRGISITVINAGTTSDTVTFDPDSGQFVAYVCSNNAATEYSSVPFAASLSSGATKVVVQYAYSPYLLNDPVRAYGLASAVDCGTGSCTLPVDRNIGTVYIRIYQLAADGHWLSRSGVQTL